MKGFCFVQGRSSQHCAAGWDPAGRPDTGPSPVQEQALHANPREAEVGQVQAHIQVFTPPHTHDPHNHQEQPQPTMKKKSDLQVEFGGKSKPPFPLSVRFCGLELKARYLIFLSQQMLLKLPCSSQAPSEEGQESSQPLHSHFRRFGSEQFGAELH